MSHHIVKLGGSRQGQHGLEIVVQGGVAVGQRGVVQAEEVPSPCLQAQVVGRPNDEVQTGLRQDDPGLVGVQKAHAQLNAEGQVQAGPEGIQQGLALLPDRFPIVGEGGLALQAQQVTVVGEGQAGQAVLIGLLAHGHHGDLTVGGAEGVGVAVSQKHSGPSPR